MAGVGGGVIAALGFADARQRCQLYIYEPQIDQVR